MNREGKKCVIYVRVSTEMQVDGFSLEGQKNVLKRFVEREAMELVHVYEDAGKSGKSIEGRPAFQRMIDDIQDGLEIDYVLVYKLSRFGRNAADILTSLELIQSYDVNLIATEEGIDSSQTSGKLLISVLSAVSEIERENIIEQTMNGRREKARQGGWNGGFAPYGYSLINGELFINEEEAPVIREIFETFVNDPVGLGGVAKKLNLQGIKKIVRQNGTIDTWSRSLIQRIIDNPVYAGYIAFGRRTKQKVKGTKNEYRMVETDDYLLSEGKHEPIISRELWEKTVEKRKKTGGAQESCVGYTRTHLLTGILRCPKCGGPMYAQKNSWVNKDGENHEKYSYQCVNRRQVRGRACDYSRSLKKEVIEPIVTHLVGQLLVDDIYATKIKKLIAHEIDTSKFEKEKANYEKKLADVISSKESLEDEIDSLPKNLKNRERIYKDLTKRLYGMYDVIDDLEGRIKDVNLKINGVKQNEMTLDNIYSILKNFNKLFNIISDKEKRELITSFIKEINFYEDFDDVKILKSIKLNFPVSINGNVIQEIENISTDGLNIVLDFENDDSLELINKTMECVEEANRGKKVTYPMIMEYIMDKYGFQVHSCNIAEVKRKLGIDMRACFNKSKKPNGPKRAPVTKEKEAAILDALKHFYVI